MSTQKNEHNPDEPKGQLYCQACNRDWLDEDITDSGYCPVCHNKALHRRRITPPTDTTGPVIDTKFVCQCSNRTFGMHEPMCPLGKADLTGCPNHFADGSKIFPNKKCCDDTTGSGREGETPVPMDHVIDRSAPLETQLAQAEAWIAQLQQSYRSIQQTCTNKDAQVEALRRDGELVEWVEQNKRSILRILQREHDWMIELTGARFAFGSTLRAAIDSAQRQEKL